MLVPNTKKEHCVLGFICPQLPPPSYSRQGVHEAERRGDAGPRANTDLATWKSSPRKAAVSSP
jgi:hypothetical protein